MTATKWILLLVTSASAYGGGGYSTYSVELKTRQDCLRVAEAFNKMPGARAARCVQVSR